MADTVSHEIRGVHMDREEIDAVLEEQGFGVLALADRGDAYGVPVSFGYGGDSRLFLYLIRFGDSSKKLDFAEQTETACLVTYDVETRFRWRSVIVTGTLHPLAEDEIDHMEEVMDANAWFPSLFPPEEAMTGVRRMELRIDDVSGRKGEELQ